MQTKLEKQQNALQYWKCELENEERRKGYTEALLRGYRPYRLSYIQDQIKILESKINNRPTENWR